MYSFLRAVLSVGMTFSVAVGATPADRALPISLPRANKVFDDFGFQNCENARVSMADLKANYEAMIRTEGRLKAFRDQWVSNYFEWAKTCYEKAYRSNFINSTGFLAMRLYPELDYDQTAKKISNIAATHDIQVDVSQFNGVQRPEDCKYSSILNPTTARKSLRIVDQGPRGTCYAHAAVRAYDYLNESTGNVQPLTSIVGSILTTKIDRRSSGIDVDSGSAKELNAALAARGACAAHKDDNWLNLNLQVLETVKAELQSFVSGATSGTEVDVEAKIKFLGMTSRYLLNRAAAKDLTEVSRLSPLSVAPAILKIVREYLSNLNAANNSQFMTFADFLYRKTYCSETVQYTPHTLRKAADARLSADHWIGEIGKEHAKTNPQAMILTFCTPAFENLDTMYEGCEAFHVVLITGQDYEPRTKQCQYQILNSWGESDSYNDLYRKDLNYGAMWMPAEILAASGSWLWAIDRN